MLSAIACNSVQLQSAISGRRSGQLAAQLVEQFQRSPGMPLDADGIAFAQLDAAAASLINALSQVATGPRARRHATATSQASWASQ